MITMQQSAYELPEVCIPLDGVGIFTSSNVSERTIDGISKSESTNVGDIVIVPANIGHSVRWLTEGEMTVGNNVTVNSVLPGPTRSEGVEDFIQGLAKDKNVTPEQVEKEFFEKIRPSSPIQRFAETSEVAALVAFVASPVASAINGAALRVDGGVVRSRTLELHLCARSIGYNCLWSKRSCQ